MFNKLAFRNAKKSIKDYLVYLITMIVVSSLMFAFNSMIFSKDIMKICSMAVVMVVMIVLATVFIIVVVSWLINYMINFIMQKKSKEFGIYLLLGVKKKQLVSLFIRENMIIGLVAFLLGILPGMFLQQVFQTIFFSVFGNQYLIKVEFSMYGFLLTFVLYLSIYILSIIKNKKKLKKITIKGMMDFDKENEELSNKNERFKIIAFFLSIIYFISFNVMLINGMFTINTIWLFLGLFILSIYMFYIGISSFIVSYIKKDKESIYKNENLFLLRQFISKIKTMQFTLSTLTIIFLFAIIGSTVAMMLNDFLDKRLDYQLPFDVIVLSDKPNDNFEKDLKTINKNNKINNKLVYNIYENGTDNVNTFLRKKLNLAKQKSETERFSEYFDYDTFMKLSDYNKLRKMLGYKEVDLSNDGYLVHSKDRVSLFLEEYFDKKNINIGGTKLLYEGINTEAFSQGGHNGADYIIVVPDRVAEKMRPLYSLLAADIKGKAKEGLQEKLDEKRNYYDEMGDYKGDITIGSGSDQIITCSGIVLVKTNYSEEIKFVLTAVSFPFMYIALVFICVALTILAVQQISDSSKYKYRYSVLNRLGLKEREINKVVLKQLLIYYLLPLIMAVILSLVFAVYISKRFIYYTGMDTSVFLYYGIAVSFMLVLYVIYFVATYVEFKRNINNN